MAAETLLVSFAESPYSPWGSACRSRGNATPLPHATAKLHSVGCISAVNALVGARGLETYPALPPLTMEGRDKAKSKGVLKAKQKPETEEKVAARSKSPVGNGESSDAQLIELATYPGFTPDHCTPLPHGMATLDQMRRVTRAQKMLTTKRDGFRECWRRLFYSTSSQAIFQDYFWWFFLQKYQPHHEVQGRLFCRVARKYVQLLCNPVDERWRDAFFKAYPDVIAQCVYSTFIHAYPNSWNSFDDNFKTELCTIISLWQVGTKPMASSWKKWALDLLEPTNIPKFKTAASDSAEKSRNSNPKEAFNLDALVKEAAEQNACSSTAVEPAAKKSPKSGHSQASLHQKSQSSAADSFKPPNHKRISMSEVKKALWPSGSGSRQLAAGSGGRGEAAAGRPHMQTASERKKLEVAKRQFVNLARKKQHHQQQQQGSSPTAGQHTGIPRSRSTCVDPPPNYQPTPNQQRAESSQQPMKNLTTTNNAASVSSTSSVATSHCSQGTSQACAAHSTKSQNEKVVANPTWKEKAIALTQRRKKKKEEEEKVPLQGPRFEHVLFNVHGQSPLVRHYMQRSRLGYDTEYALLMRRTEVSQPADGAVTPATAVTYQEILKESKESEKKTHQLFQKNYERQKQLMTQAQQRRKKAASKHEWDVNKVLFNKKETHTLSNELTIQVASKKGAEKSKAVGAAIEKTLARVTTN